MSVFPADSLPPYRLGELTASVRRAREMGEDVIDFSHVNPSLGAPSVAVDALVEAALKPYNHSYSSSQGITRLREAACEWYRMRFGVDLSRDSEVVISLGTKEGLAHLLQAIVSSGDTVLVPTPSYPIHKAAVYLARAGFVGIPLPLDCPVLDSKSSFFEELEKVFNRSWPSPKVIVLSFPHNPTTATVTECFFERLLRFARKKGVYLVHDFAYADLCFNSYKAPSILSLPGAKEVAVELYSVSKGLNLAGWRVGFCVGNAKLISALKKIKSYLDFGIFQPVQIAVAKLLLEHSDVALDEIKTTSLTYASRMSVLADGLSEQGWNFSEPTATMFLWSAVPEGIKSTTAAEYCEHLMQTQKVAICPGEGFDLDSTHHVRFALMENEARIRTALSRMRDV